MSESAKVKSTELYATLSQATKDVSFIREWLYASKDRIDAHILEHLNAFDEKAGELMRAFEALSDEKQTILNELYENVVYPFDYVLSDEPENARVNELWLKSDEGKIYKRILNPQIAFNQKERPLNKKLNDIWFKPTSEDDESVGELYRCEKVLKNEAWINPSLPQNLEPAFNQEEAPQNAELGDIWKKTSTNEYFVYIKSTSGNSWVSPENPSAYTPTYESEEEPRTANLGEIWKRGQEYFIYARLTSDTAWILKENLDLKPFVWMNEEKQNIDFILSLMKDLNQKDENELNSKNEIKDLEQNLNTKQEELKSIQAQITQALNATPAQDTQALELRKTALTSEIASLQESLNQKQTKLEQIQKDKSLITQKELNQALTLKVSTSGNENIAGNKTFTGSVHINGDLRLNANATFNNQTTFINPPKSNNYPNVGNALANKNYVDYGGGVLNLGAQTAANINLAAAQHFVLWANAGCTLRVSNWGGAGKSGTITIHNCQNVVAFNAPFNFRIAQSGFFGTEVFAYFCVDAANIRIVRS